MADAVVDAVADAVEDAVADTHDFQPARKDLDGRFATGSFWDLQP